MEFKTISDLINKRISSTDKLLKVVEDTLAMHSNEGDPLTLDPGTAGYEQVMELYLKILKAQKELAEQLRKTKISNMEFMEKQAKIELRRKFIDLIKGKSLEEIREMAVNGEFEPTNLIAATMFAEGIISNPKIGSQTMTSLAGWSMPVEPENNVEPSLTINLSSGTTKQITEEIEDAEFEESDDLEDQ